MHHPLIFFGRTIFKLLTLIIVITFFFNFFYIKIETTYAASSVVINEAFVDKLLEVQNKVREAVTNSTMISETDRLNFLKQIETIIEKITILKQILNGTYSDSPDDSPEDSPELGKESAESAGLKSILVTFNNDTDEAKVTLTYSDGIRTKHFTLASVVATPDFYKKMTALKFGLISELSNSEMIYSNDIKDLIQISARNPVRDGEIVPDSVIANKLFDNFAQQSIVNKILVNPRIGFGTIELLTDQDESLRLSIRTEFSDDDDMTPLGTYYLSMEYLASGVVLAGDSEGGVHPSEMRSVISVLFKERPYHADIPDFDNKLIAFMTKNSAYYETDRSDVPLAARDCFYSSDKIIVTDFIGYIRDGLDAQSKDINLITSYLAILKDIPENSLESDDSCHNMQTFF